MDNEKTLLREKISKRIAGGILIAGGLALSLVLFFKSVDIKIADPDTAKSIINGLWLTGCILLGVDAAQGLFKK